MVTALPAPLQSCFISLSQYHNPQCLLLVKACQHNGWPRQCCFGLSGHTNCLVYICLFATWINLAWLNCGLSVCWPIIFLEPGPLNSPLLGQTCRSRVGCSSVTEGWTGQCCFTEAQNICQPAAGLDSLIALYKTVIDNK